MKHNPIFCRIVQYQHCCLVVVVVNSALQHLQYVRPDLVWRGLKPNKSSSLNTRMGRLSLPSHVTHKNVSYKCAHTYRDSIY